jgi:hypothetical protein
MTATTAGTEQAPATGILLATLRVIRRLVLVRRTRSRSNKVVVVEVDVLFR